MSRTFAIDDRVTHPENGVGIVTTLPNRHQKNILVKWDTYTSPTGLRATKVSPQKLQSVGMEEHFESLLQATGEFRMQDATTRRRQLPPEGTKPEGVWITTREFKRNPGVIAEVLENANGYCQDCDEPAPFLRRSGVNEGEPYLEVHHVVPLAQGGDDTVENAIALCPNCHRKSHYG